MRRLTGFLAFAALLAGCGAKDEASAAASPAASAAPAAPAVATAPPDLKACPKSELADEDYRERKRPIPIPDAFAGLATSDMDHIAVSTVDGGTVCVDAGWMEGIENAKASPDKRFLSFDWGGYEAFGFIVVDRTGKGQVIETGTAPLAPPGGMRFASLDLSESGFGGFNAFGVWQIEPVGLKQLAKVQDGFPAGEWRLDGWEGDRCVNFSVLPFDRYPEDVSQAQSAPRDPWHAAEAKTWKPMPGPCPKA